MNRRALTLVVLLLVLAAAACGHAPPRTTSPQATDHVDRGIDALAHGDLDRAEAELHLALEYEPRLPHALNGLGLVAMARGDRAEALRWFSAAVRAHDDFAEAHTNLGALALDAGDAAGALPHLAAALAIDPGYAPARHNLARALATLGRLEEAREEYMKLTSTVSGDAEAWAELAAIELSLGQRAAAARAAEEALVRDADSRIARRVRGDLARDAGDLDAAVRDYDHALAVAPSDVDALIGRGLTHLLAGRAELGHRDLERAVGIAPRSSRARFALGVAFAAAGDDAHAAALLEHAATLAAEDGRPYPEAHYLRAGALGRQGRKQPALAAYRQFLHEAEGDATLAEAVADAHIQITALGGR